MGVADAALHRQQGRRFQDRAAEAPRAGADVNRLAGEHLGGEESAIRIETAERKPRLKLHEQGEKKERGQARAKTPALRRRRGKAHSPILKPGGIAGARSHSRSAPVPDRIAAPRPA